MIKIKMHSTLQTCPHFKLPVYSPVDDMTDFGITAKIML